MRDALDELIGTLRQHNDLDDDRAVRDGFDVVGFHAGTA